MSSLKLQQGASAAELSAMGQLVMLTQRIGKSASEFLTIEGVSPEAVFLLGKDLKSFRELAEGVISGNAELRLPGTREPQARERMAALLKQYEAAQAQASAILGNLKGLVAARDAQAVILADSEPLRKGLQTLQERLAATGGLSGLHIVVMAVLGAAAAGRRCRHPAPVRAATRPRARSSPKASASRPSARSRKPSASTTPTRRPFCG